MYITIGVGEMNNTKSHYPCPLCPLHAYYTVCGILFCKPQVSVFGWTFRNELWIKPSKVVCWVLRILSYFFFFLLAALFIKCMWTKEILRRQAEAQIFCFSHGSYVVAQQNEAIVVVVLHTINTNVYTISHAHFNHLSGNWKSLSGIANAQLTAHTTHDTRLTHPRHMDKRINLWEKLNINAWQTYIRIYTSTPYMYILLLEGRQCEKILLLCFNILVLLLLFEIKAERKKEKHSTFTYFFIW